MKPEYRLIAHGERKISIYNEVSRSKVMISGVTNVCDVWLPHDNLTLTGPNFMKPCTANGQYIMVTLHVALIDKMGWLLW